MNSGELYDLFRKDVVDTARPYLWSDEEVFAYMNDAYVMFVRLTGGIPDYLSDVCTVVASTGEATAELHPKILTIRQANLEPNGEEVRVINAQDMGNLSDEDFGVLRRLNSNTAVGKVRYMVVGMEEDTIRWVNIPDADYEVHLLIERLPLEDITTESQEFADVKPHHHLHFLKWMKHLAYAKQDADTFDKKKSMEMKMDFENYCYMSRREKDKYKHKVRVVRYGGI